MCTLLPSESYTLYMYARRCNAFTNRRLKKGRENYNRLIPPSELNTTVRFPEISTRPSRETFILYAVLRSFGFLFLFIVASFPLASFLDVGIVYLLNAAREISISITSPVSAQNRRRLNEYYTPIYYNRVAVGYEL